MAKPYGTNMADEMTQNDFSRLLGTFLPGDKFREVTMLLKKVCISILFSFCLMLHIVCYIYWSMHFMGLMISNWAVRQTERQTDRQTNRQPFVLSTVSLKD